MSLPLAPPCSAAPKKADTIPDARRKRFEPVYKAWQEHLAYIAARGKTFRRIAAGRAKGEPVLYRDEKVTAFPSYSDPAHPRHAELAGPDELPRRKLPSGWVYSHLLVIPNEAREHIGKTLSADIDETDLEATSEVMRTAKALAKKYEIQPLPGQSQVRIYIHPQEQLTVGYLHVHIEGMRSADTPYPPPLEIKRR